jgi:hypothetical protein
MPNVIINSITFYHRSRVLHDLSPLDNHLTIDQHN